MVLKWGHEYIPKIPSDVIRRDLYSSVEFYRFCYQRDSCFKCLLLVLLTGNTHTQVKCFIRLWGFCFRFLVEFQRKYVLFFWIHSSRFGIKLIVFVLVLSVSITTITCGLALALGSLVINFVYLLVWKLQRGWQEMARWARLIFRGLAYYREKRKEGREVLALQWNNKVL